MLHRGAGEEQIYTRDVLLGGSFHWNVSPESNPNLDGLVRESPQNLLSSWLWITLDIQSYLVSERLNAQNISWGLGFKGSKHLVRRYLEDFSYS